MMELYEFDLAEIEVSDQRFILCRPQHHDVWELDVMPELLNLARDGLMWRQEQNAIQMELAESICIEEMPPWTYLDAQASRLRPSLAELLGRIDALASEGGLR